MPQVWIFLLVTLIVLVVLMCAFSFIYTKIEKPIESGDHSYSNANQVRVRKMKNPISFYTVYVLNIITNHGIQLLLDFKRKR